jgi:hypothetical protein
MGALPTGTVTFLFTDIEGSTRLLQQLGDRYADVLATHHRLLSTAIQEANGQVVDTQGDAVFAAFPRARDALLAAIAAQRAVQAHPWPEGSRRRYAWDSTRASRLPERPAMSVWMSTGLLASLRRDTGGRFSFPTPPTRSWRRTYPKK